eukprot:TRINITY_DN15065_c0_g1_i4.p2 TRINITY_DN15065_c0_g1~~TRINITY_DN15065_c0_g1_i4.p2  ORF type:complete len:135 (+),score=1.54 TRINITY_DN15065_c0_g1_i4:111-515(+)
MNSTQGLGRITAVASNTLGREDYARNGQVNFPIPTTWLKVTLGATLQVIFAEILAISGTGYGVLLPILIKGRSFAIHCAMKDFHGVGIITAVANDSRNLEHDARDGHVNLPTPTDVLKTTLALTSTKIFVETQT